MDKQQTVHGQQQEAAGTLAERIERHRRMAESYRDAYSDQAVQEGATYDEWRFSEEAVYWSPYFGDNLIRLAEYPISVKTSAHMEAKAYSVTMPDWAPISFRCWPSDNGFVMQTHFGGHTADGVLHDFHAYGYVETDEECRITRWETHVSPEYNDFLDVVLGVHGPFKAGPEPYMKALGKRLQEAGVTIPG